MTDRSFVDTNVLVYTDDRDSSAKRKVALDLVEALRRSGTGVISSQVLQEYYVATTRKLGVDPAIARRKVELFASLDVVVLQVTHILAAIDLTRLHRISFWDALIVQAALASSCRVLYSEDFALDRPVYGLRVINPFA
jgi:predicted nucleic acid-binding protein